MSTFQLLFANHVIDLVNLDGFGFPFVFGVLNVAPLGRG
jgi:hypothetical protein